MPQGKIDVDFKHVRELGNDLIAQINALREASPIFWSEAERAWIVSGHAQVVEGFSGRLPLSVERMTKIGRFIPDESERARRIPTILRLYPIQIVNMDPPQQSRMRRLMMPAFGRQVVERNRMFIRQAFAEAFDQTSPRQYFDFVRSVANVIPGRFILRLIGLPETYLEDLWRWTAAIAPALSGGSNKSDVLDVAERCFVEMERALIGEVSKRRREPTTDFISTLMAAEFEGDKLSDDEVIATCIITMLAGNDTTANTMALSAVALARNPSAWSYIREQPTHMPDIVMEMMRYIAMSTTQSRTVARDFEWEGHQLKRGDLVYLMIMGANRDPAKFENPEQLDFKRSQVGNMTFGPGLHMCIGHLVARMQIEEFFQALVARYEGIELESEVLDWSSALSFRGLRSLRLRLIPKMHVPQR